MKKRLIALALVLCMVFSIFPVSAVGEAAGSLTLGEEFTVAPLAPDEERFYTVDVQAGTRYFCYYAPIDENTPIGGDMDPAPSPNADTLNGDFYQYGDIIGIMFICDSAETVNVHLQNFDPENATNAFKLCVVPTTEAVTDMKLSTTQYSITLDERFILSTFFEPAFTFDENVVFSVDNPIVYFEDSIRGKEVHPLAVGTANITAIWANGSATCAVEVTEPVNTLDITDAPQTVTTTNGDHSKYFFKFTAPEDADEKKYVIYTDANDQYDLKSVSFGADTFQSDENELVLPENLIPGETYYLKLDCYGVEATDVTVTLEERVAPSDMVLNGGNSHFVGNSFYMDVDFPSAKEYTPVEWTVENENVAVIDRASNYAADFRAVGVGTTTVTATVPNTDISKSITINVTNSDATPEVPPQAISFAHIDVGDGTFTFIEQDVESTDQDYAYVEIPAGSSLASCGYGIKDVTYWDPDRDLEGWEIYALVPVTDEEGNFVKNENILYEEGIYTTEGILDYLMPAGMDIFFRAKWAGDDSQYMFSAQFDTWGGMISVNDNTTQEIFDVPGALVFRLRKDGTEHFADAVTMHIVGDPTHPTNGTFQGWLKYTKAGDEIYLLSSENLLTTFDIYGGAPANEDVIYAAKWSNVDIVEYYDFYGGDRPGTPSTGNYVDVTLDGQGGTFTVVTADQTVPGVPFMPNSMMPGLRVRDHFTVTDVLRDAPYEFFGWMIVGRMYDADGLNVISEDLLTPNPISTDEMLDFIIPEYNELNISAQWVNTDSGEGNDPGFVEPNVAIDANDGNFSVDGEPNRFYEEFPVPDGANLKLLGVAITDPIFWESDRGFDGWEVLTIAEVSDEFGNVWHEDVRLEDKLLTTAEMVSYIIPADMKIVFRAKWAGDDNAYYTHISFNTLGGELQVTDEVGTWTTDYRGDRVRKDGKATWQDGLLWTVSDPTHPDNGAFEGWLVFQKDADDLWVLVDNTLYTSAQVLASAPMDAETMYVAKWSNIPEGDYEPMLNGGSGNNGGYDPNLPIPVYTVESMTQTGWLMANDNGYLTLEFTPSASGLYMIGHLAYADDVLIEEVSPAITNKYDHDIMVDGDPYCGPVYNLKKGVTYQFKMHLMGPDQMFYIYNNVEATDIYPIETELTGYVGSYVELYYEVYPANSFSGVNTSTSSNPEVAYDAGGANYDCSRVIQLEKAGTANITITLANGKSITVKVNAIEPPALKKGKAQTATIEAMEFSVWKFTAPKAGIYYVTADCANGECALYPSNDSQMIDSFYSGTTCGIWLNLQKGETATINVVNPGEKAQEYTVKADIAPTPTAVKLDNWDTYPNVDLWNIRPTFEPLGAYDEVVSWKVSNPKVLSLTDSYLNAADFVALKPGKATVTVKTASGLTGKATFTVNEFKLDTPVTFELEPEEYKRVSFLAPKTGTYFVTKTNPATGFFVENMLGYAYKDDVEGEWVYLEKGEYGYFDLYGSGENVETTTVTVTRITKPITSMTMRANPVLYVGSEAAYVYVAAEPFGACDFKSFKIADESIVEVAGVEGYAVMLNPKKAGTTTLTVTTEGGVSASYTITVQNPVKAEVGKAFDVSVGEDRYVVYSFTIPEDGQYTVQSSGLFEMELVAGGGSEWFKNDQIDAWLAKGEKVSLYLYTTDRPVSGTIGMYKLEQVDEVTVPDVTGVVGQRGEAVITIAPQGGWMSGMSDWEIADPEVAEITDTYYNGVVLEFLKAGTTTLTLRNDDVTCTATVTVKNPIHVSEDTSTPTTVTETAVDTALENAISEAKPGETVEVVIKVDAAAQEAGTTVTSVEVPVASLEKVIGADAVLTVELTGATVTLDNKALAAIVEQAGGAAITLSVENIETNTLTEAQQKVLTNKKVGMVISAKILSDGKVVGDFKGGNVTISVPFTPPAGKNGNSFSIWYVADDGTMEKKKTSFADGVLTFVTDHFSDYVAIEDETNPPASNPATGDNFMLIPALLLFAVSAIAIIVLGKKRRV